MMLKLTIRPARLFVLAAILIGSIFGSFHGSATLAQIGPEEPILYEGGGGGGGGGGGTVECVTIPAGCMSFGCNGNPPNYQCSLSVQQEGATCTSGGPCRVR